MFHSCVTYGFKVDVCLVLARVGKGKVKETLRRFISRVHIVSMDGSSYRICALTETFELNESRTME
jgi:hypothetical protein